MIKKYKQYKLLTSLLILVTGVIHAACGPSQQKDYPLYAGLTHVEVGTLRLFDGEFTRESIQLRGSISLSREECEGAFLSFKTTGNYPTEYTPLATVSTLIGADLLLVIGSGDASFHVDVETPREGEKIPTQPQVLTKEAKELYDQGGNTKFPKRDPDADSQGTQSYSVSNPDDYLYQEAGSTTKKGQQQRSSGPVISAGNKEQLMLQLAIEASLASNRANQEYDQLAQAIKASKSHQPWQQDGEPTGNNGASSSSSQ